MSPEGTPASGRIPGFPTEGFPGPATRAEPPSFALRKRALDDLDAGAVESPLHAWECGDCGWSVTAAALLPGWSLQDARLVHSEKYCARPPTWPPS